LHSLTHAVVPPEVAGPGPLQPEEPTVVQLDVGVGREQSAGPAARVTVKGAPPGADVAVAVVVAVVAVSPPSSSRIVGHFFSFELKLDWAFSID